MKFINKFNIRKASAVIACMFMAVMLPEMLSAGDSRDGLFAALRTDPSVMEIAPEDRLVQEPEPVKGNFLVASPRLEGTFFSEAVILLLNHSNQGSKGLVINRPSHLKLSSVFYHAEEIQKKDDTIYTGGPVEFASYLILLQSDSRPPESHPLMDNLYVTSSTESVKYLYARPDSRVNFRVYFGYAGWKPGQLMSEIERGSWHVMSGDAGLVFDEDTDRLWEKCMRRKADESRTGQGEK
jgi:putative transcriptional regulator